MSKKRMMHLTTHHRQSRNLNCLSFLTPCRAHPIDTLMHILPF